MFFCFWIFFSVCAISFPKSKLRIRAVSYEDFTYISHANIHAQAALHQNAVCTERSAIRNVGCKMKPVMLLLWEREEGQYSCISPVTERIKPGRQRNPWSVGEINRLWHLMGNNETTLTLWKKLMHGWLLLQPYLGLGESSIDLHRNRWHV